MYGNEDEVQHNTPLTSTTRVTSNDAYTATVKSKVIELLKNKTITFF